MIFFHFFIFINLVTVTDRGVKVGQDDQKLVKMTNLTITPPQSRGLRGSPAYQYIDCANISTAPKYQPCRISLARRAN